MEGLLILLGLGVLAVPFVLPIVALRRASRVGSLVERLTALEEQLIALRAENIELRALVESLPAATEAPAAVKSDPGLEPLEETPTGLRRLPPAPEAAALAALDALAQDARREARAPGKVTITDVAMPATPTPPATDPTADAAASLPAAAPPSPPSSAPASAAAPASDDEGPTNRRPAQPAFNWEQWLGVRGAAVLGGVVLALAGILFFQYSIQHGLISPAMRVVIGTLVGVGCLVGSTRMRGYGVAANALGGAGAVILYACFWAARALYQLVPMEAAFVLMALTTAATAIMAARYGSLLIAALGLTGGFLTPLMLSTGANRPFGLFGYLLVLDCGFLVVAFRRRWGGLALFALAGTLLLEALWVSKKMEPGQLAIGVGATGLFAVLFLAAGARAPKGAPRPAIWLATQVAAVLLPHAFALYFAVDAHLGRHLYPTALLLLLLGIAALYVARTPGSAPQLAFLPSATGAATLAVVASWLGHARLDARLAWEAAAVALGLCLPAAGLSLRRRSVDIAALLYAGGLFVVLGAAAYGGGVATPWPWLGGLVALAIVLVALGRQPGAELIVAIAPALLGAALAALPLVHGDQRAFSRPARYLIAELIVFLGGYAHALALHRRHDRLARRASEGALLLGALLLGGAAGWSRLLAQPAAFVYLAPLAWTVLLLGLVLLRGDGRWLPAAALPVWAVHCAATGLLLDGDARAPLVALVGCAAAVALFARAPLLGWPRLRGRVAFYVAALAGLAWLLPSLGLYRDHLGTTGQGGVPLVYAALGISLVPAIRRRLSAGDPLRKSALAWVAAAALGLLSIAIPVELERQWITIGYALEVAALLLLWQRLDHPGLKYFALVLAGAVGARLCLNPAVLSYADRGGLRILNWVLYTYWVPALALLVGLRALQPIEIERLRDWELGLYVPPRIKPDAEPRLARPLGTTFLGLLVIVIVFVWINLAIADWFGRSSTLTLDFERKPARDLTTSIAWALYAIVLLSLGVWRKASTLRWVSLAIMVVTIGKVFLYDLGELKDLYRVVSLLGLAISLILVSLAYQRFVFRKPTPEPRT